MPVINVTVRDKVATTHDKMVCGNKDYSIVFDFDDEWSEYETKTAKFVWDNGSYQEPFDGNECKAPAIFDSRVCLVGVYAGDLRTTTPAIIECQGCILDYGGTPKPPSEDVYNKIMEMLNNLGGADPEAIEKAVSDYLDKNPVQSYNVGDGLKLDEETNTLSVDTADEVEQDNTRPITSAAVYTTVGNIEILLGTI